MLSTRQAHHVLRLAERRGAKVVFAGDTRQQQPVEAGPGLRLIRDAVGSVRVDRIRRQKPDLEDILVHVRGETPSATRFRGGLMGEEERIHLHGVERGGERLASALARAHKILYEDNRHIAATRKPVREDEDVQACKEGIAYILDDPEKLRELRIRSAERRREEERRSEGRHQSRGISM